MRWPKVPITSGLNAFSYTHSQNGLTLIFNKNSQTVPATLKSNHPFYHNICRKNLTENGPLFVLQPLTTIYVLLDSPLKKGTTATCFCGWIPVVRDIFYLLWRHQKIPSADRKVGPVCWESKCRRPRFGTRKWSSEYVFQIMPDHSVPMGVCFDLTWCELSVSFRQSHPNHVLWGQIWGFWRWCLARTIIQEHYSKLP